MYSIRQSCTATNSHVQQPTVMQDIYLHQTIDIGWVDVGVYRSRMVTVGASEAQSCDNIDIGWVDVGVYRSRMVTVGASEAQSCDNIDKHCWFL